MQRAITWITSLVALVILFGLPAGYFAMQYAAIRSELRLEAEDAAQRIMQLVNADPELWQFQAERMDEILARRPGDATPEVRTLHDAQERVVATSTQALDTPLLAVTVPVFDAGREVGRIEVVRSLRSLLLASAFVAMLAALLAGAVIAVLRLLPMRALRRAENKARELAEQAAWLEKAHRDAVAEARLKTHFLARLTHEIRTPLGGLLGMTESLRDAPMSAPQRLQAQRAHESGAALLQVVNDILDYSRSQGNELVVAHEQFDPVPLVEGVIDLMTPQASTAGLTLYYELGPGLPAQMEGDPGRLRQVLNNLVSNSVKFTPRGDIKINVKWNAATPSMPASIYFEVRDTGVGLSPQEQAKLFEPMLHVEAGAARQQGGSGMGLAISRQLVESMGGRMGLLSQPGQGARFWFELPQKQSQFALGQAWPTDAAGAPLHALVADPHIGRARAMCSRLMALGLRVNAVHNSQALRAVLAKPGLRFTHILSLDALGVKGSEAPWLNWITLHDGTPAAPGAGDSDGTVLNLPCRREDLVRLLTQMQAARPVVTEVPKALAPAPARAAPPEAAAPMATRAPVPPPATVLPMPLPPMPEPAMPVRPTLGQPMPPFPRLAPDEPDEPDESDVTDIPTMPMADAAPPPDRPRADRPPLFPDEVDTVTDPVLEVETPPLPVRAVERRASPALRASAARAMPPSVLLVEANEVSQEMGRALLESMGCEVYVADDGHAALQRLPQGFGLILLDLQIAGMDGYTTTREIRRWEAGQPDAPRTPVVALTADDGAEVRMRCVGAGMDDIVGKPVDRNLLREMLERYLPALVPV